jgi:hypothetical protein
LDSPLEALGFQAFHEPRRCQRLGTTPSSDFLVFLLVHAAVNNRLLFDFPHNITGLFIVSQSDKGRVPQVTIRRPLGKLYLGDQFRL